MADIFSSLKRSQVMACIKSKGNMSTELVLVNLLRKNKITGWRRNQRVFGKPDFIFRAKKIAIFVDGCFWHGCPRHGKIPKGNSEYWKKKLELNKVRDRMVSRKLRNEGWDVIRFWECSLAKDSTQKRVVQHLLAEITRDAKQGSYKLKTKRPQKRKNDSRFQD